MKKTLFTLILGCTASISFSQHGTGRLFDEAEYEQVEEPIRPLGWGEDLPERVSLKQYVPSIIGDQGRFGTCVGWSSTYYVATMEYAIQMGLTNRREIAANVFDPYYTYLSCTSDDDYFYCEDGLITQRSCEHLVEKGVKRFDYNTYECGSKITSRVNETNSIIDFTGFYKLYIKEDGLYENIRYVQKALADNHPVLFGMYLPNSFKKLNDPNSDGVLTTVEGEGTYGGHAMAIIGYDDNLHGGCFIGVNSWGKAWGDDGFFYIRYADYFKYSDEAFYLDAEIKELEGESGCVFGDCEDGYGRYTWSDGDIYEGDFTSGSRGGYGVYIWPSNSHFGGEWQNGDRHGKGVYTFADESTKGIYWKEGKYNEYNYVYNEITGLYDDEEDDDNVSVEELVNYSNPVDLRDLLKDSDFLEKLEETNTTDCVYGDCSEGLGMYINGKDWLYMGYFKDGYLHGAGEIYWLGDNFGYAYLGELLNGNMTGMGSFLYPSGAKYYGEWVNGERHGNGAMFFSDGDIEAGEWIEGSYENESLGFGNNGKFKTLKLKVEESDFIDPEVKDIK